MGRKDKIQKNRETENRKGYFILRFETGIVIAHAERWPIDR